MVSESNQKRGRFCKEGCQRVVRQHPRVLLRGRKTLPCRNHGVMGRSARREKRGVQGKPGSSKSMVKECPVQGAGPMSKKLAQSELAENKPFPWPTLEPMQPTHQDVDIATIPIFYSS